MEEKDFLIIRSLVKLAATSPDPKTLAIACNDLAQFSAAHPHGRYIVNDLEGKGAVMALMGHADATVQKHALLCVQVRARRSRARCLFVFMALVGHADATVQQHALLCVQVRAQTDPMAVWPVWPASATVQKHALLCVQLRATRHLVA